MFKKVVSVFLLFSAALVITLPAHADNVPTIHQVYLATKAGKLAEAERMMDIVLKAHPDSAKAHLIDAEILAKDGQMSQAQAELDAAEKIEPGLPFAKPAAIHELQARIASGRSAAPVTETTVSKPARPHFPWGLMLLGLLAIAGIYLVVRAISARNAPGGSGRYYPATGMPGGSAPPYGGSAPMMSGGGVMGGGMGSGIVSGLATGAAVGAGMVAGEELAHHFLDGDRNGGNSDNSGNWDQSAATDDDMGGTDFGINDNSSWDDSANVSDSGFGGGDDWT